MYIIKNAFISITRNKGRNILLGIILFVIGLAVTISLAITSSADKLIKSYEEKYDVEASISVNRENMRERMKPNEDSSDEEKEEKMNQMRTNFKEVSNISTDDIKSYGDSDYVKSYYYTESVSMNSTIEKASSDNPNDDERGHMGRMEENVDSGDFTIKGYSSLESMQDFINGSYKIIDGEINEDFDSYTCVINSELANLNNLSVGSTITIIDPKDESKTYELTISGIFEEKENSENMDMFSNSANSIITNTKVVEDIKANDSELNVRVTPTFILKSKDVIEKFTNEVKEKGLSDYLTVSTNLDMLESSTESISNVKNFATTLLIITIVIGAVILLVLNAINIRERKYEIGVLRTIGMKKSTLTIQFALELLIVTIISLMIGTGIGAASSLPVSNKLLENEINSSQQEEKNMMENFGKEEHGFRRNMKMNGMKKVEAYDKIDAVIDMGVLAKVFGIGILLTLISTLSSMISIQKFSPLQILKERS